MTSDLQADLDAIAQVLDRVECLHVGQGALALTDAAKRLRHLLDDRGIDQASLTSEIVAWLDADPNHVVEWWFAGTGLWEESGCGIGVWRARLRERGDQRQYGYRLGVREPEPATEHVALKNALGRKRGGEGVPRLNGTEIVGVDLNTRQYSIADLPAWLDAPDGTVEVLKDGAS